MFFLFLLFFSFFFLKTKVRQTTLATLQRAGQSTHSPPHQSTLASELGHLKELQQRQEGKLKAARAVKRDQSANLQVVEQQIRQISDDIEYAPPSFVLYIFIFYFYIYICFLLQYSYYFCRACLEQRASLRAQITNDNHIAEVSLPLPSSPFFHPSIPSPSPLPPLPLLSSLSFAPSSPSSSSPFYSSNGYRTGDYSIPRPSTPTADEGVREGCRRDGEGKRRDRDAQKEVPLLPSLLPLLPSLLLLLLVLLVSPIPSSGQEGEGGEGQAASAEPHHAEQVGGCHGQFTQQHQEEVRRGQKRSEEKERRGQER